MRIGLVSCRKIFYYKKKPEKLGEYTLEQAAARAAIAYKYGF